MQIELGFPEPDSQGHLGLPSLGQDELKLHTPETVALPKGVNIRFVDVSAKAGIQSQYSSAFIDADSATTEIGTGVAWIDYDQDGLLDLFVAHECKLFKNLGEGNFKDVTAEVGLSHVGRGLGVAVGDIDNDGYPDFFVTRHGKHNMLFHNVSDGKGGRRFQDISVKAGLAALADGQTSGNVNTSAAFLDYNNDGYLDLFVCGYSDRAQSASVSATRCFLYRNNRNGTFTDVSQEAGITQSWGKALGVVALDLDNDGQVDIFVTTERTGNLLFRNLGNGRFESLGPSWGCALNAVATPQTYRGVDADDLLGTGRPDLFACSSSQETKPLWRNEGKCRFLDICRLTGLGPATWYQSGFGTCLLDVDRDGSPDIFVTNGHVSQSIDKMANADVTFAQFAQLFLNDGRGRFREVSSHAGSYFRTRHAGRAVAYADYDNDGHMDLALNNCTEPPTLLHNETSTPHHWIRLELRGTKSNRDAIGAKVTVYAGGRELVRYRKGGGGYLSASDPRLLIGLGPAQRVDKVEIRWPGSSRVEQVGPLLADRGYLIVEGEVARNAL
jgi:hypothetical protein